MSGAGVQRANFFVQAGPLTEILRSRTTNHTGSATGAAPPPGAQLLHRHVTLGRVRFYAAKIAAGEDVSKRLAWPQERRP